MLYEVITRQVLPQLRQLGFERGVDLAEGRVDQAPSPADLGIALEDDIFETAEAGQKEGFLLVDDIQILRIDPHMILVRLDRRLQRPGESPQSYNFV